MKYCSDIPGSCRIDGTSATAMGRGTGSHVDNVALATALCSKQNQCSTASYAISRIGLLPESPLYVVLTIGIWDGYSSVLTLQVIYTGYWELIPTNVVEGYGQRG